MTPGNNGASTPEDDDPFGYLYADGQASGATPPGGGGGYGYPGPRSSYHQVRPVGERQYGNQTQGGGYGYPPGGGRPARQGGYGYPPSAPQQQPTAAYGQAASTQQAPGYHQQNPHYRAPETMPGSPMPPTPDGAPPGGRGGGPNHRGLLIGAIAVVAAVVIGIGIAVLMGGDDDSDATAGDRPTAADTVEPSTPTSAPPDDKGPVQDLPKSDAQSLKLAGGAVAASDIKGAQAEGGTYVGGLNHPGASVTWTVNDIAKAGKYTLQIGYGVPGKDANVALSINGKPRTAPLPLKNWANAKEGDWEKGWTRTFAYIELNKGTNNIKISCEAGNQCDANLDQFWLENGWEK